LKGVARVGIVWSLGLVAAAAARARTGEDTVDLRPGLSRRLLQHWVSFCLCALLAACGGAAAQVDDSGPDDAPTAAAANGVAPPGAPAEAGVGPTRPRPAPGSGPDLSNAAQRDMEMERLLRTYVKLTRTLYERFMLEKPPTGGAPTAYDPVPAWRYQAEHLSELGAVSTRARRMLGRLDAIAELRGTTVARGDRHVPSREEAATRPGRLRLYHQLFSCLARDVEARMAHGRRFPDPAPAGPAAFEPLQRGRLLQTEMALMMTTISCSTLLNRRYGS
jgi:hypothetical protein